jgi:hypothetical protein
MSRIRPILGEEVGEVPGSSSSNSPATSAQITKMKDVKIRQNYAEYLSDDVETVEETIVFRTVSMKCVWKV